MNHIFVLTSYPRKGSIHGRSTVGGASYIKNICAHLAEYRNLKITILAEKMQGEPTAYKENSISVRRVWQKGRPSFLNILKKADAKNTLLVNFEYLMFGTFLALPGLLVFLFLARLKMSETIFVLHQPIIDIKNVSGHIVIKNRIIRRLINLLLKIFYFLINLFSDKIIVFEHAFARPLSSYINPAKIKVIPHAVELRTVRSQYKISQKNKYILLYFGFIAWYKGVDWLIEKISGHKNIELIIAGGLNQNHQKNQDYKRYTGFVIKKAKQAHNISITGFVKESNLSKYFAMSDLVVFPYRSFISSSGALSLASAFEKPFIISSNLRPFLNDPNVKSILKKNNLKQKDIVFELNNGFGDKAEKILSDRQKIRRLTGFSRSLKTQRSIDKISLLFFNEIT